MAIEFYDSLNVDSNDDSYFLGKVGIGTTSPNEKLQVAGNIHAYAPSGVNAELAASTAAGSTTIAIRSLGVTHFNGGNVGIGTSSPNSKLGVVGNIDIQGGNGSFLTFNNGDANIVINNNGSGRDLSFQTYNGSSTSEKMRINKDGNVGIGTTSPSATLDVRRSDASGKVAEFHNNVGYGIDIDVESDGGVNTIASATNQSLAFVTNGGSNERMRINKDGNVGIGTTSPARLLQLTDGEVFMRFNPTTVAGDYRFQAADGKFYVTPEDTGLPTMTYSSGNVGIGTTSPAHTLDVKGADTDDATIARFYSNAGTRGSFIIRNGSGTNPTTFIGTSGGGEQLSIGTNGTESIRIDGSGNVGIGTTSPAEELTVIGDANITGKLALGSVAVHPSFAFYNQNNAYFNGAVTVDDTLDLVNLKVSGAQGTDGQVLTSTGSGVAWEDVSGGSSPWTTDTNGITYTAGNVGIGAASQANTDLRVGGFARFNGDVRFDGDVQCAGGDLIVNNSLKDVNSATGTSGQILSSEGSGGGVEWIDAGVKSSTSGEPSGSDSVINIVSLTQAEYNAGTPVATTLYIIT